MDNLIGKVVALKSGSPLMTVNSYAKLIKSSGDEEIIPDEVVCKWFDEHGYCLTDRFHVETLRVSNQ